MKENNKKRNLIITLIAIPVLIVMILISSFILNYHSPFPDIDDGPGIEVDEKSLVFYNRDILELAYTIKLSSIILTNLKNTIFSPEEMKYSTDNSPQESDKNLFYDAIIDMGDLISYDPLTTKFNVNISDNRKYIVLVKSESLSSDSTYLYTAISRDASDAIATLYINGDKKDEEYFKNLAKEKLGRDISEIKYYSITDSDIEITAN